MSIPQAKASITCHVIGISNKSLRTTFVHSIVCLERVVRSNESHEILCSLCATSLDIVKILFTIFIDIFVWSL